MKMKKKYKCPSHKRRTRSLSEAGFEEYQVLIADELVEQTRWDYVGPHDYWDYLHDNCKGNWVPSTSRDYCYLIPGRPWAATAVMFEKSTDAVKFMLKFGGTPLTAILNEHADEVEVYTRLQGMYRMSRAQRRATYPGLDEIIQARKGAA